MSNDFLESADVSAAARDSRAFQLDQPPRNNQIGTEYIFFPKHVIASSSSSLPSSPCPIGDFVCLAERSMKSNIRNEVANTMIKSVAAVMTEMLNSTISRSLGVFATARNSQDPQAQAQAQQAMTQVTGALQNVSSKVIQAFAYFVKVSISGVMWDLFNQVVSAAKNSEVAAATSASSVVNVNSKPSSSSVVSSRPVALQGNQYFQYSTGAHSNNADLSNINPSSLSTMDNNNLKRAAIAN